MGVAITDIIQWNRVEVSKDIRWKSGRDKQQRKHCLRALLLFLERKSRQKELQESPSPTSFNGTELRFPRTLGGKVAETNNKGNVASELS